MLKIFCSNNQNSYARWLGIPSGNLYDADIFLLTGGEDISPSYYNQRQGVTVWSNRKRDEEEMFLLNHAIKLKKKIVGTCRGMQMLTVYMGGSLIQDINHPFHHLVKLDNGNTVLTNSLHHQLCNPLSIRKKQYELIAWSENLTPYMFNGRNQNIIKKDYGRILSAREPEAIIFPKIRALGVQGHPEMMQEDDEYVQFLLQKVENL